MLAGLLAAAPASWRLCGPLLVGCELVSTVTEKLCWRFPGAGGREGLFYFRFSDAACLEGVKSICL